jgi:energy-coupling factor transporter transmembrane protein EcfT
MYYFFGPNPGSDFAFYPHLLTLVGILFLIGLAIKIQNRRDKDFRKVFNHTPGNYFTVAVIILILLGARYEGLPFISMRAVLAFTLLSTALMIFTNLKAYFQKLPEIRSHAIARQHQSKQRSEKPQYTIRKKKR